MALTVSTDLAFATQAPDFTLIDPLSGRTVGLDAFAGKPLFLIFMCNHCPYVVHMLDALIERATELALRDVATIAISANDPESYPADAPDRMAALAKSRGFTFPYVFDASQEVARAYSAVCTPDPYLFDASHRLFYRGQFDASRPGQGAADGADLMRAVDDLLAGSDRPAAQQPSVGCSIKWRSPA